MRETPQASNHPSAERLVAFAESKLGESDAERLRAHLESCDSCREMVDDLRAFGDLESPGQDWAVGTEELESTLDDLKKRLPLTQTQTQTQEIISRATPEEPSRIKSFEIRSHQRARSWLPWAAVLVLALGFIPLLTSRQSLEHRVQALEKQLAQQQQPQIIGLKDLTSSTRSSSTCLLTGRSESWFSNWRAPITGSYLIEIQGRVSQTLGPIELDENMWLAVQFESGSFTSGDYLVAIQQIGQDQVDRLPLCFRDPSEVEARE